MSNTSILLPVQQRRWNFDSEEFLKYFYKDIALKFNAAEHETKAILNSHIYENSPIFFKKNDCTQEK